MTRAARFTCAALALLAGAPAVAWADWFGIGKVAEAVSDATWKIALVRAAERAMPSLILLVCILGGIVAVCIAGLLVMRFFETCREALRDGRVNVAEAAVLIVGGLFTLGSVLALGWFGWFLMQASYSGLSELMQ